MIRLLRKLLKPENILFFIALFLALVIGLHAFITHDHPHEIFGVDNVQAYLHGGDKKYLWTLTLAVFLAIAALTFLTAKNQLFVSHVISPSLFGSPHFRIDLSKLFDSLCLAFRRGIFNPKLYEL